MGLQVGQDAAEVSLDLTLDNFGLAKEFLEDVLGGICQPHNVAINDMLTEGGRTRLVLASGGVARDYLNLARMALRRATERTHRTYLPRNRITAEDVNEASAELSSQKQEDLRLDSGENAERLRLRLADVARFCLDFNGTNVFLVAASDLHETEWGAEIESAQARDLRTRGRSPTRHRDRNEAGSLGFDVASGLSVPNSATAPRRNGSAEQSRDRRPRATACARG